jgi:hypothetical protein
VYSHIAYARQVTIKQDVVADAFSRIGRIPLESAPLVAPSPERGYRMRARLHVRDRRAGFYREGTHQLCDAAPTGQLLAATLPSVDAALAALHERGLAVVEAAVTENIAGDERALHFDLAPGASPSSSDLERAATAAGATGCSARTADGVLFGTADPRVADPLEALTNGRAREGSLRRRPESFFQGNR